MENEIFKCTLSKTDLIKLIEKYYAENERNISVEIDYIVAWDLPGCSRDYVVKTIISASENVSIAGMNLTKKFNLSMDEVKSIVKETFEKDGYEFFSLLNNVSSKESILKALTETDYGRTVRNKTFTVSARVKEEEKILQKKQENNK